MTVYSEPLYYEVAFSFVDPKRQADLFEELICRYSRIGVRRVLDVGCGPSFQLRELARRGYEAVGLDISPRMLEYLEEAAKREGVRVETVLADMTSFRLVEPVDFAFNMMGTISYVRDNAAMLSHLASVAASLKPGGLYLIENFRLDWTRLFGSQSWTMERDGVSVKTTYEIRLVDALSQTLAERMTLDVDNHGERRTLVEDSETKMIFPQEFLTLVETGGEFEFLGWFRREKAEKLTEASNDNVVLLRRRNGHG